MARREPREGRPEGELSPATLAIERAILAVPAGRVATYGRVAEIAGLPNGARQVARVLHSRSAAAGLPWHRVVGALAASRSGGRPARARISLAGDGFDEQRALLESEGVRVDPDGSIDLATYGWEPPAGTPRSADIR